VYTCIHVQHTSARRRRLLSLKYSRTHKVAPALFCPAEVAVGALRKRVCRQRLYGYITPDITDSSADGDADADAGATADTAEWRRAATVPAAGGQATRRSTAMDALNKDMLMCA
jgi:hypothetical protein